MNNLPNKSKTEESLPLQTLPLKQNKVAIVSAVVFIMLVISALGFHEFKKTSEPKQQSYPVLSNSQNQIQVVTSPFGNGQPPNSSSTTTSNSLGTPIAYTYDSLWKNCQNPLPVLPSKSGLVKWMKPQLLKDVTIFGLTAPGSDFIYDHSYLVGKFTGGKYQGGDLLLTDVSYAGFSGSENFDHIVRLNGKYYFLNKYSTDKYPSSGPYVALKPSVDLTADRNFVLSDLDFPTTLHSDNPKADFSIHSTNLLYTDFNNLGFCADGLQKVFTDPIAGDVYTDNIPTPTAFTLGGFYVKAPDSTERVYEINVDIIAKDKIQLLSWSNGKKNNKQYSYQMPSTCGPETLRDVANVNVSELVQTGTAFNGTPIYEYKDSTTQDLKSVYDRLYTAEGQTKPTYINFTANHPVFFWQDPLGYFVRFKAVKYEELVSCG